MKLTEVINRISNCYYLNNQLLNINVNDIRLKLVGDSIMVNQSTDNQRIGSIRLVTSPQERGNSSWIVSQQSASQLLSQLQSLIIDRLDWENRLSAALSYKHPVTQVLNVLAELVENPMIVFDSSLKMLGHIEPSVEGFPVDWQDSIRSGYLNIHHVNSEQLMRLFHTKDELPGQLYNLQGFKSKFYLQKVSLRNSDHFYLIIVARNTVTVNKDEKIINSVLDKLAATVGLHNFPYQSQGGNLEGLLRDILVRPNISLTEIQNRLRFDPHQLKRPLAVLSLRMRRGQVAPLGTILTKFVTLHYEDNDVYLIENYNPTILQTLRQELIPYLKLNHTVAGVSNQFDHLHNFNQFYEQSVRAMRLGHQAELNQYGDFIGLDLVDHIKQDPSLANYLSPRVVRLFKDDPKLFNTLKQFLLNRENKKQTAANLHIHRSTLDYRLGKVEQKYQIEVDTPNQYLYSLLSLLLINDE